MPNAHHHALHITVSPGGHVLGSWTAEYIAFIKSCPGLLWYALKHEVGANDQLHVHIAFVFEICSSATQGGAKRTQYFRDHFIKKCPLTAEYAATHGNKHTVLCAQLKSTEFIAEYIQKEGLLKYSHLPDDLLELRPYFSDLQAAKVMNPDFESWSKLYAEDSMPMPATPSHVWIFLTAHMHERSDIKVVTDRKRLMERCIALSQFINKEVDLSSNPFDKKRKADDVVGPRMCPRCDQRPVAYRCQYCDECKNYHTAKKFAPPFPETQPQASDSAWPMGRD